MVTSVIRGFFFRRKINDGRETSCLSRKVRTVLRRTPQVAPKAEPYLVVALIYYINNIILTQNVFYYKIYFA